MWAESPLNRGRGSEETEREAGRVEVGRGGGVWKKKKKSRVGEELKPSAAAACHIFAEHDSRATKVCDLLRLYANTNKAVQCREPGFTSSAVCFRVVGSEASCALLQGDYSGATAEQPDRAGVHQRQGAARHGTAGANGTAELRRTGPPLAVCLPHSSSSCVLEIRVFSGIFFSLSFLNITFSLFHLLLSMAWIPRP